MKNVRDSIYPLNFLHLKDDSKSHRHRNRGWISGLLLALALPETHFVLFEPIAKKSAFLHLAKSTLELKNVQVSTNRVEKVTPFKVDLISSRAVTNTKMLISLCKGFIDPQTLLLFYKGELVQEEIEGLYNCEIHTKKGKRNYLIMKDIDVN